MEKTYYGEGLFFDRNNRPLTEHIEEQIRSLLVENHGVGIVGGYYRKRLPISMVSELMIDMLGYDSFSEFMSATGQSLQHMVSEDMEGLFSEEKFAAMHGAVRIHMRAKDEKLLWVRLVKEDAILPDGSRMWVASVCDMDEVYEAERTILQINKKLERANQRMKAQLNILERQTIELEKANREANLANAAKSDFLARMSHDIRTPINGILGLLEMSEKCPNDVAKLAENRAKERAAANQLLALVNDVLDMSKLESGEIELAEEPFDLNELADQCLEMIYAPAKERQIRVKYCAAEDLTDSYVIGSAVHVRQILSNILSNAVKYNRVGGSISVNIREIPEDREHTRVCFMIRDTGIGMSEEFQKKMFEPFTQEGRNGACQGTGLGMAIIDRLVKKMDGVLKVRSQWNEGTTFLVTLPFRTDPDRRNPECRKQKEPENIRNVKVLLVEDNELNREIAQFLLEDAGAVVDCACDGKEAVNRVIRENPAKYDVILMDIMMPVMNGYEAARAIRAWEAEHGGHIPMIAMTANAFVEDIVKCREAGMDEHIPKPLNIGKVIETIVHCTGMSERKAAAEVAEQKVQN